MADKKKARKLRLDSTTIYQRNFSFKHLKKREDPKATLWNISPPRWPGAPGSKLTPKQLSKFLMRAYDHSETGAHMVLWLPASELHQTEFNPLKDMGPWFPASNIVSGGRKGMHIGYVYSKGVSAIADWDSIVLLDERNRRGSGSSHAMKFMLEELVDIAFNKADDGLPLCIDPFINRSGELVYWTRRMGIPYVGYTSSGKLFDDLKEKLAQVELPGIQVRLPAT